MSEKTFNNFDEFKRAVGFVYDPEIGDEDHGACGACRYLIEITSDVNGEHSESRYCERHGSTEIEMNATQIKYCRCDSLEYSEGHFWGPF